ncbi:uncharacterized protein LOC110642360 [Hevea brasiliensis]|uniref:uncharacterized protein LOC110642360 n=1 Tax=Hevea brasiliensis TaxID=3981 RepID=UPI0025F0FD5A|nr:uncharacterized protein LOC110642360 [Hevea brasiliensis]
MAFSGSNFCFKVNYIDRRLPCSCINSFDGLPHLKDNHFFSPTTPATHCFPLKLHIKAALFAKTSRLLSLRACQVTSEDSEEMNYAQAAKRRDSLRVLQEDSNLKLQYWQQMLGFVMHSGMGTWLLYNPFGLRETIEIGFYVSHEFLDETLSRHYNRNFNLFNTISS